MENAATDDRNPIDVVIAWVNGNDARLTEKRNRFLNQHGGKVHSGADPTRFASINEIRYCVLSILKFAPFVRNIFIVTDEQDPNLYDDIKTYFPQKLDSVRIVDHKEIFKGFERFLPTFNSISIGNMIWRIKGLSERFVYFNDDIFLVRQVKSEDWFIEGKPVMRGGWLPAPYLRIFVNSLKRFFNLKIFRNSGFHTRASFHLGQWASAALVGFRCRYFSNGHTAHAVNLQLIEKYFSHNKAILERNLSFRFRDYSQFTFISLSNHLQLINGNRNFAKTDLVYFKPVNRNLNYINKKTKQCEKQKAIKYLCVQSLEMCPKEGQDKLFGWLDKTLGLNS